MYKEAFGIGSRLIHPEHGKGVVTQINATTYSVTFFDHGEIEVEKDFSDWEVIDRVETDEDMVSLWDVEQSMVHILRKWANITEIVPIADKWKKGTMILKPFDNSLQSKEISIDIFFHKIVMLRDRLRVMEQKINSQKELPEDIKIDLQQYITRIYGTLTTFNVLFASKDQYFTGVKSK